MAIADFIVQLPQPLACGTTNTSSLVYSNWPSTERGNDHLARRFAFSGTRGYLETIRMDSPDFDTYLYPIDPSGKVVAESGGNLLVGSQITYTLRTNGIFIRKRHV